MRILLSAFFFLIIDYSFSQTVGDRISDSTKLPAVDIFKPGNISNDFHLDTGAVSNKKINIPGIKFKKLISDSKTSLKLSNPLSKHVTIDSASVKKQNTDTSSNKKELVKSPLSSTENNLLKNIKSDTSKSKISVLKIDPQKNLLRDKKNNIVNNGVLSGYKKQKFDVSEKMTSVKNGVAAKKDSILLKGRSGIKSVQPTAVNFLKKQLKVIEPKGTVSLGYEYGVLPFVAGDKYPSGGYKAEGRVSFLVLNIPLELMFSYTDIKNVIGINNYFRVSYDADRYKDQLAQKMDLKSKLEKEKLSALEQKKQELLQKIEYLNILKQISISKELNLDNLKNKYTSNTGIKTDSLLKLPGTSFKLPDTSGFRSKISNPKLSYNGLDTSELGKINKFKNSLYREKDSLETEYKKYKTKYDTLNNEINKIKGNIDQLQNIRDGKSSLLNPYFSKVQRILSGIKKFEIGLCHPSYSTFLVNNVPLQGINLEYSKNNNFLAFTYGTTVNTLLYNTKTIQGTLQGVRNMYNYFDFGNLSSGRKILSLKGGFGAKDDSHIYVGFMLGRGRTDYLMPEGGDGSPLSKESNLVLELDAKYKISEYLSADVILGKSSVKEGNLTTDQIGKSIGEIFSNYRSYALLTRLNSEIKKTNTKLTFTVRWVDPYFKSFGLGFLRSDNLRYEFKAEQPITKRIKYSIAYRREEDNLLQLYDYKNTLQSINNSLSIKLNRRFNIRLNYIPLFRQLKSAESITKDQNQIATIILSYIPKAKKINSQFNFLYSKYLITSDSGNINFENFTYTHQFQFKSGFKTGLNISWFKNNLKDTLNNDTYLGVLDVGYAAKDGSNFSLGGKMAYKKGTDMQYGFIVKASVKLYKGLFGEADLEKILIGDYYNNIILGDIKKFPYYCNLRLTFNF